METILLACPSCGKQLKAKPPVLGRSVKCPACGNDFIAKQVEEAGPLPVATPVAIASPMVECAVCRQQVARAAMEEVDGQLCCPRCCAGRHIGPSAASVPADAPAPAPAPAEPAPDRSTALLALATLSSAVIIVILAAVFFHLHRQCREPVGSIILCVAQGEKDYELESGVVLRIRRPSEDLLGRIIDSGKWLVRLSLASYGIAALGIVCGVVFLVRRRRLMIFPLAAMAVAAAAALAVLWCNLAPMTNEYRLANGDIVTTSAAVDPKAEFGVTMKVTAVNPEIEKIRQASLAGDFGAVAQYLDVPDKRAKVRYAALDALDEAGPRAVALPALIKLLEGPNEHSAMRAALLIGKLGPGGAEAAPAMLRLIERGDPKVTFLVREAILKADPEGQRSLPGLAKLVEDGKASAAVLGADIIADFGEKAKSAAPALSRAIRRACAELAYVRIPKGTRVGDPTTGPDQAHCELLRQATLAMHKVGAATEAVQALAEQLQTAMALRDEIIAKFTSTPAQPLPRGTLILETRRNNGFDLADRINSALQIVDPRGELAVAVLAAQAADPDNARRLRALDALCWYRKASRYPDMAPEAVAAVRTALTRLIVDKDRSVRAKAAIELADDRRDRTEAPSRELLAALTEALGERRPGICYAAARHITGTFREEAKEGQLVLSKMVAAEDKMVADLAFAALNQLGLRTAAQLEAHVPELRKALQHKDPGIRQRAAAILAELDREEAKRKAEEAFRASPVGRSVERVWPELRKDLDNLLAGQKLDKLQATRLEDMLRGYVKRAFEAIKDADEANAGAPDTAKKLGEMTWALESAIGAVVNEDFSKKFHEWVYSSANRHLVLFGTPFKIKKAPVPGTP